MQKRKFRESLFPIFLCIISFLNSASPVFANPGETFLDNLPEIKKLSNGLSLIYQQDESSAITVLQILIKGGKGSEAPGKDGVAYLTTRLALEIPDYKKVQKIMSQATRISLNCKSDYSFITVSCLSNYLEDTIKLLTDIMLDPLFSGIRIDNAKDRMNHQRKAEEDDSIRIAHNLIMENFFKGTAYEGSLLGSEDSLKALKKRDVQDFYDHHFIAGNMIAAVSTDLEREAVFKILEKYFEEFPPGIPPEKENISAVTSKKDKLYFEKDKKQAVVSVAFLLPGISPKTHILSSLLETLLGKGINSKLWSLRTKEKLAYTVNANVTLTKGGGVIEAYLETDSGKKETAMEALKTVLHDLYTDGITEEEFKDTKSYYKASFLRENETKENRAHTFAFFEAVGFGYEFFNKYFQEIDAVSLEEMNSYLKTILNPEKAVEIVVGPGLNKANRITNNM